jgi:hypothetical protein
VARSHMLARAVTVDVLWWHAEALPEPSIVYDDRFLPIAYLGERARNWACTLRPVCRSVGVDTGESVDN